jgi:hypothetical protein
VRIDECAWRRRRLMFNDSATLPGRCRFLGGWSGRFRTGQPDGAATDARREAEPYRDQIFEWVDRCCGILRCPRNSWAQGLTISCAPTGDARWTTSR